MATATPPASARTVELSLAVRVTLPRLFAVTTLFVRMLAEIVCSIVFAVPTPAPASEPVRPLPEVPPPAPAPPMASARMLAAEVALRPTVPAAVTVELSINAFTEYPPLLPISFLETAMPTDSAPVPPPAPRFAEIASAKPPASARMLESSLAVMVTPPPLASTPFVGVAVFLIEASIVLSILLCVPEPAPASEPVNEPPEPPAPAAATPSASASMR